MDQFLGVRYREVDVLLTNPRSNGERRAQHRMARCKIKIYKALCIQYKMCAGLHNNRAKVYAQG